MLKLSRILFFCLTLAACGPQPQQQTAPPQPHNVSHIVLEIDSEDLRAQDLNTVVSRGVREKLREAPLLALGPDGRKIVGDHLEVKVANPADTPAAEKRVASLERPSLREAQQSPSPYVVTTRPDGVIELRYTEGGFGLLQSQALDATAEILPRRIDAANFANVTVEKQRPNRLLLETPGMSPEETDRLIDIVTRLGVLTINLVDEAAKPADYELGVERNGRIALPDDSQNGAAKVIYTDPILTGADIADAEPINDLLGHPAIAFKLHPLGAMGFAQVTEANVGRVFAVTLDGHILSTPVIRTTISDGAGQITGNFSQKEAESLAVVLRSGALPVKLKVIERVVAP